MSQKFTKRFQKTCEISWKLVDNSDIPPEHVSEIHQYRIKITCVFSIDIKNLSLLDIDVGESGKGKLVHNGDILHVNPCATEPPPKKNFLVKQSPSTSKKILDRGELIVKNRSANVKILEQQKQPVQENEQPTEYSSITSGSSSKKASVGGATVLREEEEEEEEEEEVAAVLSIPFLNYGRERGEKARTLRRLGAKE
eukprot:jgi/Bigna1/137718/aug1.40_g12426